MNRLPLATRTQIAKLLTEGCSMRAASRLTDTSITTVSKLLVTLGKAALKFHSTTVVGVRAKRIEVDETWAFIHSKNKNAHKTSQPAGDCWTWIGIDPDTKLVISWFVGKRDQYSANFFMNDLWCRLRTRVQLTSDGFHAYEEAVADTFGSKIDFAQLVKMYSKDSINAEGKRDRRNRYVGAERTVVSGNPNPALISTSMIERQNLTMRTNIRRFTRKTNAFSKKVENHCYAIALHFYYYNFVRVHSSIRVTPAMESGLTKRIMNIEDIVKYAENMEGPSKKRGPYKKKISN